MEIFQIKSFNRVLKRDEKPPITTIVQTFQFFHGLRFIILDVQYSYAYYIYTTNVNITYKRVISKSNTSFSNTQVPTFQDDSNCEMNKI